MKKILLVLMLIFLGHSAFAMYCWEEKSPSKDHTSAMTSKLGASNIVKVSTFLTATYAREVNCRYVGTTGANCASTSIGHNVSTAEYENGVSHGASTITNTYTGYYNLGGVAVAYPQVSVGGFSSYKLFDQITLGARYAYPKGVYNNRIAPTEDDKWNYWFGTFNASYDGWSTIDDYIKKETRYIEYISPYYTHTFCTTAGGGGGGAAGAAVNYIIKAD